MENSEEIMQKLIEDIISEEKFKKLCEVASDCCAE
jgi:hypothetical protein